MPNSEVNTLVLSGATTPDSRPSDRRRIYENEFTWLERKIPNDLYKKMVTACNILNEGLDPQTIALLSPATLLLEDNAKDRINKVYKAQALRNHPDKVQGDEQKQLANAKLVQISNAREQLTTVLENSDELELFQEIKKFKKQIIDETGCTNLKDYHLDDPKIIANLVYLYKEKCFKFTDFKKLIDLFKEKGSDGFELAKVFDAFRNPYFVFNIKEEYNPFRGIIDFLKDSKLKVNGQQNAFDFMERSDLTILQKFYLYYWNDLSYDSKDHDERNKVNALVAFESNVVPFAECRKKIFFDFFSEQEKLCGKCANCSTLLRIDYSPTHIKNKMQALIKLTIEPYLVIIHQQVFEPIKEKIQQLEDEKKQMEKESVPPKTLQYVKDKISDLRSVLTEMKQTVETTMEEATKSKYDSRINVHYCGYYNDHLQGKLEQIAHKHIKDSGVKQSRRTGIDVGRFVLGLLVGAVTIVGVIFSSNYRNFMANKFYRTSTQSALVNGTRKSKEIGTSNEKTKQLKSKIKNTIAQKTANKEHVVEEKEEKRLWL